MVAGGLVQLRDNYYDEQGNKRFSNDSGVDDKEKTLNGSKWGLVCVGVGDCKVFKFSFPYRGKEQSALNINDDRQEPDQSNRDHGREPE